MIAAVLVIFLLGFAQQLDTNRSLKKRIAALELTLSAVAPWSLDPKLNAADDAQETMSEDGKPLVRHIIPRR
jgi:hypothetical protein